MDRRLWVVALGLLSLVLRPPVAWAGPPAPAAGAVLDAPELTARIDQLIAARWAEAGVQPAEPADDAEFLRRVSLDLAGRIPSVAEVRAFLEDKTPDKRRRVVERLLDGPECVNHFANVWRALLLPRGNNQVVRFLQPGFENWLRQRLRDNVPYDQLVRELLTVPVNFNPQRGPLSPAAQARFNLLAFYQANELKPENLAGSTARLFLGVKIECAQCHDHPFASWKRKQFWEFAAFFGGIQAQANGNFFNGFSEKANQHELKIPGTERTVRARFLDGKEPTWQPGTSARKTLADWMTAPENPYFARTAANRLWAQFFGIGLVEPVDEAGEDVPASHPELLDELARQLVAHRYDLRYLARAITASRAYQLGSARTHPSQDDPRLFARMALRGLSPEQLFDSLAQATGFHDTQPPGNRGFFFGAAPSPRDQFLAKFAGQDRPTEFRTSILQALALMNGTFVADATSLDRSETLAAVADAPFLDAPEKVEALFLAALSRKPSPEESRLMIEHLKGAGPGGEKAALADVFWVLLNSSEFLFNH